MPNEKKMRGKAFMQALQRKVTFLSLPNAKKGDVMKALKDIMKLMPQEDEINALKEEKGKLADKKDKMDDKKKMFKTLLRKKTEEALSEGSGIGSESDIYSNTAHL